MTDIPKLIAELRLEARTHREDAEGSYSAADIMDRAAAALEAMQADAERHGLIGSHQVRRRDADTSLPAQIRQ